MGRGHKYYPELITEIMGYKSEEWIYRWERTVTAA